MEFRRNFLKKFLYSFFRQFLQLFGEFFSRKLVIAEISDTLCCRIKRDFGIDRKILHKLCKVFPVM